MRWTKIVTQNGSVLEHRMMRSFMCLSDAFWSLFVILLDYSLRSWYLFVRYLLVACDDAKLKIWDIPAGGLTETLVEPSFYLHGPLFYLTLSSHCQTCFWQSFIYLLFIFSKLSPSVYYYFKENTHIHKHCKEKRQK